MFKLKSRVLWAVTVTLAGLILGCGADAEKPTRPAKIAFTDDWQSIFVMNPDGTGVTRIGEGNYPSFAPDGSKIVFGGSSISVMDPDGTNVVRLSDWGYDPTYSPDGTRIAFARAGDIFVMNADGSELKQLTNGKAIPTQEVLSQSPTFSPDGSKIAFTRGGTIWVMGSDGTDAQPLLADPYYNSSPVFTPDATGFVFTSNRGGKNQSEIYAMDASGDHIRPLTEDSTGHPTFSPDGTKILFSRNVVTENRVEIWVMNRDGSDPHRLTDLKTVAQMPSWGRGTDS